jgi:hypothetical protein
VSDQDVLNNFGAGPFCHYAATPNFGQHSFRSDVSLGQIEGMEAVNVEDALQDVASLTLVPLTTGNDSDA